MPHSHPSPARVVVTHAVRTPIGKFLGAFAERSAADLGVAAVEGLFQRAGLDPARVGETLFGNARQAGGGPNVARQIAVRAGVPERAPAWTINMACGSGLKAILLGAESIQLGRADVVVAGGTESMSGLPYFLPRMRLGYRLGDAPLVDGMYQDGFHCPLADMLMGETAEKLAQELDIPRDEQDRFALDSQHKAAAAWEAGRFEDEIVPVRVPDKKGERVVERDEHFRADATLAGLAKLPPVFEAGLGLARGEGTVTAGNASGITDGAAAVLLMRADTAERLGYAPLATLGESVQVGLEPERMGLGPVPAVEALRAKNRRAPADYDLIELNEAFAAQVLACDRTLDLPRERLNVNGGSIALGHPIGATGARIVVTLLHELARRGGSHGLATLCISGGLGLAAAFERNA